MEITSASQESQSRQDGLGSSSRDNLLTERFNLAAVGFVYHPRLMLFTTRLSEGLNQESTTGGHRNAGTTDYELRTTFLADHPYTLDLFKLHQETYTRGALQSRITGLTGTEDQQGANLSCLFQPFSFSSSYLDTTLESPETRTESKSYRMHLAYKGRITNDSASYAHTETLALSDIHTSGDEWNFGNTARYAGLVLNSRIFNTDHEQIKPLAPDFEYDRFDWTEQLTADLPWNFNSALSYAYDRDDNRIGAFQSAPATEIFNRTSDTTFNLTHRLYHSVLTNYTLNDFSVSSASGDVRAWSESLSSTYTKSLPLGVLSAGIQLGKSESARSGTPQIVSEVQLASLGESFPLNQQNVDTKSISVQVKDPLTESLIPLPQADYIVTLTGTFARIVIQSVSPATPQLDPAYKYEFHVAYSLTDQSKIEAASDGYSMRLSMLENLLTVYYNYSASRQELVSGSILGGADRSTSETTGMSIQDGPYSGLAEHSVLRSRLNPQESWKTRSEYRKKASENVDLSALVSYAVTEYFPAESIPGSIGYREAIVGTALSTSLKFPRSHLMLAMTGSFYRTRSLIESDSFTSSTSLAWHVGLLSVSANAQLNRTETLTTQNTTAQTSQYYLVTVTRKLW